MPSFSVLIVEPDLQIQIRLEQWLSDVSFIESIYMAASFAKGLELLPVKKPEILILEISSTNRFGLALLSKDLRPTFLREIIVLTNHPENYYKEYCNRLGINYFLDKSFELDLLPGIIEKINKQLK